jgi:hypothetical protein
MQLYSVKLPMSLTRQLRSVRFAQSRSSRSRPGFVYYMIDLASSSTRVQLYKVPQSRCYRNGTFDGIFLDEASIVNSGHESWVSDCVPPPFPP